ncbi:hypothetical protein FGO68_gene4452 [Halteria grandinella]|uniref:Tubby C-terminal domain-containing protein n=1 Tax=Halteria grandinella TaxID=5974 RepID=A0A8J8N9U1_HALGN|nr:hypothetical protein FGO68_gene4452 [Halteria grandinella]
MKHNNDAEIIDFDELDSQPVKKNNARNFQDNDDEEIIHEPGMGYINQQGQDLPQLERPKTSAYQMQIQQRQPQQQQQQQQKIESEDSVSDTDHKSVVDQSIVDFKSEIGDAGVEQEDMQQQVQPRVQELQRVDDNDQQIQMQQQQPPLTANSSHVTVNPFPPKMEPGIIQELLEKDRRSFLTTPLMQNKTLQCYIKRDKSGLARLYPVYHVFTTEGNIYLFSAKKVVMNTTSNYVISMKKNEFSTRNRETFLGKVRSNFLGTEFILLDEGQNPKKCKDTSLIRTQLGVVYYESHIMQNKGPRKMKVLLPKVGELNIPKIFQPLHSNEGIQYDYQNKKLDYIEVLVNKPPRWDAKMKAHVLNFYGRVDQPSVKNFQLINENNPNNIFLQFGRVDDLNFNLDFCYPITPLQAFQICVTSFDFKFACE